MSVADELRRYMDQYFQQHMAWPKVLPITGEEYWQLRDELAPLLIFPCAEESDEFRGIRLQINEQAKEKRASYERVVSYK